MKNKLIVVASLLMALFAIPSVAHHSASGFDFSRPQTVTGVVEEFRVINPHSHIRLRISDGRETRIVGFEGHSASNFFRAGYRRRSVNAGDRISVTFAPMRNGDDGGFVLSFVTSAGQRVGFGPA